MELRLRAVDSADIDAIVGAQVVQNVAIEDVRDQLVSALRVIAIIITLWQVSMLVGVAQTCRTTSVRRDEPSKQ